MGIFGWLSIAAIFYAAATYENLTGWKWAAASLAVSITINKIFPFSFLFILPAQFALFLVMWWANTRRKAARALEMAAAEEGDRRARLERARAARERAPDPATSAREADRAAKEEAALKERQERVRRAREEREREEREAREKEQRGS